ncbi:MAG: hypothetical protein IJA12_06435 [Oscillospiraceae bacterium]|nr:hypothetical protein [Oscillospiraceae bacterium]
MTAEDWKYCEEALSGYYGRVRLKVDDYDVTLAVVPTGKLKQEIAVYVNGEIRCEWFLNDCDIRQRFYQEHKKCFFSQKDLKKIKREKKEIREMLLKGAYHYWYSPTWTSFRSLKSHLLKNNQSIELDEKI